MAIYNLYSRCLKNENVTKRRYHKSWNRIFIIKFLKTSDVVFQINIKSMNSEEFMLFIFI